MKSLNKVQKISIYLILILLIVILMPSLIGWYWLSFLNSRLVLLLLCLILVCIVDISLMKKGLYLLVILVFLSLYLTFIHRSDFRKVENSTCSIPMYFTTEPVFKIGDIGGGGGSFIQIEGTPFVRRMTDQERVITGLCSPLQKF